MLEKLTIPILEDTEEVLDDEEVLSEIKYYVGSRNTKMVRDYLDMYRAIQPYSVTDKMLLKRMRPFQNSMLGSPSTPMTHYELTYDRICLTFITKNVKNQAHVCGASILDICDRLASYVSLCALKTVYI